jgi:hypothetical protein
MVIPNTFSSGETITASDHNENFSDIADEITNSLARDGQSVMSGQFKASAGDATAPGISFSGDLDTGFFRKAANTVGISAGGSEVGNITPTTFTYTGTFVPTALTIPANAVVTASITDASVTLAKMANLSAGRFVVRYTGSTGVPQAGTFGDSLTLDTSTGVLSVSRRLLHVQDQKSPGTAGGTATSGAWRTRTLNTAVTNEIAGASLASNQITLPAGTYEIDAEAPAGICKGHRAKLYDTTHSTDILLGTSEFSESASGGVWSKSRIRGRFTLSSQSVLEIQHQVAVTRSSDGFGSSANFSTEIYTDVQIRQV